MLRRRLSSGLLRAQIVQQPTVARAIPAVPALPARYANVNLNSNRGLASAVLLSSRENWANKTVKNLKEALAQRGLSQSGKKVALVERLKDYETSQSPSSRSISSSAIAQQTQKNKPDEPVPETPKVEVASGVEANINNLAEIEVPEVEPALAPGLPEAKTDLDEAPPTLDIKMPEFEDAPKENALPPFEPDNFDSKAEESLAPPVEIESSIPKVMTVDPSQETTRHSLHETESADDITLENLKTVVESSEGQIQENLPSLGQVLSSIRLPSFGLGEALTGLVKVPEVQSEGKEEEFKPIERGLNSEERNGAFILAAIVGLGLALGGGKKKVEDDKDVKDKVEDAAKAAAH